MLSVDKIHRRKQGVMNLSHAQTLFIKCSNSYEALNTVLPSYGGESDFQLILTPWNKLIWFDKAGSAQKYSNTSAVLCLCCLSLLMTFLIHFTDAYEIMIQILQKYMILVWKNIDLTRVHDCTPFRSQICICHNISVVMTCHMSWSCHDMWHVMTA